MAHRAAKIRDDYRVFYPITTRWSDNDVFHHVNNVIYYSYFDTVVCRYLIQQGGLDIENDPIIGLVVNSGCTYQTPVAFPDQLEGGIRVDNLGNSSVQYGVGIFSQEQEEAVAFGHFVHVFVDRKSNTSVPIPQDIRDALTKILM